MAHVVVVWWQREIKVTSVVLLHFAIIVRTIGICVSLLRLDFLRGQQFWLLKREKLGCYSCYKFSNSVQKFSCSLSSVFSLSLVPSSSSSSHNFFHQGSLSRRISSLWHCCALAITGADRDVKASRISCVTSWSFGAAEKKKRGTSW